MEDSSKPAIRRATAASLLARAGAAAGTRTALGRALSDPNPLVRMGALGSTEALDPRERVGMVFPLLRDPVRTVRIEAARELLSVPKEAMSASERAEFEKALAEYVESQRVDADRAEAHLNLAAVALAQGDLAAAEAEYRIALARTPALGGAWANLADLYRVQGRDDEAEKTLRQGLAAAPKDPGVHHALGLALVRLKRMPEALRELRIAAELPPERPHYVYVYGVALDSVGQTDRALEVLAAASARHPGDREILQALVSFSAKAGNRPAAIGYAKQLLELDPGDAGAQKLLADLNAAR